MIETLLQYVKRKLKNKAYNRAEITRATGINSSALSNIASGENQNPSFKTVQILADYFQEVDK